MANDEDDVEQCAHTLDIRMARCWMRINETTQNNALPSCATRFSSIRGEMCAIGSGQVNITFVSA